MHLTRHRKAPLLILALIVAAAVAVRALPWWNTPLWLDEAYSAYAAEKGFRFLWQIVPQYEVHPPFYYSMVRVWMLMAGDSLHALRLSTFICAGAGMIAVAAAAREVALALKMPSARPALVAALLAAASPVLIEMGREVRPYPVMILAYAVGMAAAMRLGHQVAEHRRISAKTLALYLLALEAVLWLHSLGPLFGAALGVALLLVVTRPRLDPRDWAMIVGGFSVAALLYLPALKILTDQAPTWVQSTWLKFEARDLQWRLAFLYASESGWAALAATLLAAGGVAALCARRHGWRFASALVTLAILPTAASILISVLISPVFIVRVVSPTAVPALILMAIGATELRGRWRWPAGALAVALLALMAQFTFDRWPPPPRNDWYGAMRWLAPRYRAGDVVLAYPNEGALPFDFAARDLRLPFRAEPIPEPVPSFETKGAWYPTGSRGVVSLPQDQLRAIAERPDIQAAPTVWLLRLGPWAYDKGDVFLHELMRGRLKVSWLRYGPIDIVGLRRHRGAR